MRALWPLIADTWRQSRQQAVFLIMIGLLSLTVIGAVVLAQPVESTQEDGSVVERVGLLGLDGSELALSAEWSRLYAQAITKSYTHEGETPDPFSEEGQQLQREQLEAAQVQAETEPARKCVEALIHWTSFLLYGMSMLLFIAACAGYFPAMLEAGAVDIVLAKPLERWKVFFGKYLGGLALYAATVAGAYLLLFIGLGLRTGVWHLAVFRVLPLQLLSAATLFAIIALLGVARGSTGLAMVVGYIYYVIIDRVVKGLLFFPFASDTWQRAQTVLRYTVPNFIEVRNTALVSIIHAPALDWQPILVIFTWLLLALGLGYWLFARSDY
jgi:ABC-type transport system involved in multi-copper enzyme maturation permease subunit